MIVDLRYLKLVTKCTLFPSHRIISLGNVFLQVCFLVSLRVEGKYMHSVLDTFISEMHCQSKSCKVVIFFDDGILQFLVIWNMKKLPSTKKEVQNSNGVPLADGFWLRSLPLHVLRFLPFFWGRKRIGLVGL